MCVRVLFTLSHSIDGIMQREEGRDMIRLGRGEHTAHHNEESAAYGQRLESSRLVNETGSVEGDNNDQSIRRRKRLNGSQLKLMNQCTRQVSTHFGQGNCVCVCARAYTSRGHETR